jgi:regulatory protein
VGGCERALELAFRHLGKRDRTEAELRRHLAGKDIPEAEADAAIAEVARMGYLDDARYAKTFAEDRRYLDGWGAERIERRLLELGVEREHVAAALGDRDVGEELEAALELLRRRLGDRAPGTERERERALGMLVRKGYDLELAYDAVRAFERAGALR